MTSTEEITTPRPVERMVLLDDLHIRSDGSGRIVEAYAAVFGKQTEIQDQDGHYREENHHTSFNRTIGMKAPTGFGVLFNHARTVDGAPNPAATMPIGVPIEVKADETGVFTATRYLDNPMADWTLDAIKAGALRAQSYSGRFLRSVRQPPSRRGDLATITRMEIDMREYGPAVFAAYGDAAILGTRTAGLMTEADLFLRTLLAMPGEKRLEWLQQFETGTTLPTGVTDLSQHGTSDEEPAESSEDSTELVDVPESHSKSGNHSLRTHIFAQRQLRGIPNPKE